MICEKHPKYKAIYQPKCDCLVCWIMYEKTMIEQLSIVRDIIRGLAYPESQED